MKLNNEKYNFNNGTKIYVCEKQTPVNETIPYNYRKLKDSGLIHACYGKNGIVQVKETEKSKSNQCVSYGQTFFCIS